MSDSNLPLISIAICTYNGEKYIKEQVDSLIKQTYPNIEIVICDDCSTDQTYSQLQSLYCNNNKIRLYRNSKNLGLVNNFLHILSLCNGDYIALCDQDDIWLEHKIETLNNKIQDNILIYADSQLINEEGELLNKKISDIIPPITSKNTRALVYKNTISGHTMMFRKDLTKYIKSIPLHFHDWWIAYIANCVGSITYVNECLVHYRQHQKNVTDILNTKDQSGIIPLHLKNRIKDSQDLIDRAKIFLSCEQNSKSDKQYLERLISGHQDRMNSYFLSYKLFYVLITNLSLIKNKNSIGKFFYVLKESFGLQTKILFHKTKHSIFHKNTPR